MPVLWIALFAITLGAAFLVAWTANLVVRVVCPPCRHEIVVVQNFGSLARRTGCVKCGKSWYVHDDMLDRPEPWGEKHVHLYRDVFGFTLTPWKEEKGNNRDKRGFGA